MPRTETARIYTRLNIMKRTSLLASLGLALTSVYATAAATLTSGHVDAIGIGYDGTDLDPHSHVEGGIVDGNLEPDAEFAPGDLIVQTSTTSLRLPGAAWDAIGVAVGQSFWSLLETDIPGQPFAGFGAEELDKTKWSTPITITLTGMMGPAGGQFSLWQTDGLGAPTFFMSTLGGVSAADTYSMNLNVSNHQHFGWGFTAEGTYDLTFKIDGTHVTDGAKSATATYKFSAVPEPSSALLGAFGALAILRRRRN
jgi:surface-anchored protein